MKVTRRKRDATLDLPSLRLEGGLFLPDQLAKAAHGLAAHQTEADYHTPKGIKLKDDYSRAFQIGCAQWKHFAALIDRADIDANEATTTFVTELLRDVFGYTGLVNDAGIVIGERHYPVTLMAANRLPIIVAPHTLGLDDPDPRFAIVGSGSRRKSAFQLAQELLNAGPDYQWGLVSNGKTLRLLRDAAALTRPSFLEVDLQDLLGGQRLGEFASAWRLLHASRAGLSPGGESTPIVWEQWREDGQQEGTRVREGLREGVTQALLTLGTGFLQHPANDVLRRALQDGELSTDAYFQQLLRFVYRLIFVFSVEERGLLHPADDSPAALVARRLYAEGYALARLRKRCLKRRARNRFDDLWQSVRIVFRSLAAGEPRLALPALGGLFAPDQCRALDASALINAHLLQAVWYLRWARLGGTLAPVDYRNMGPEELGSVYESLLELVPEIDLPARQFGFIGLAEASTTAGNARKLTGSYYTPDSLVQELIKSALEPVIEQRLAANPAHPTEALLSIRVVDPACGSGHFLLAAARRLAERLAQLRAPDGAVKPQDYRHALREVIARCIFGVDRNPLALELARTALWLEGFEEGRPLSFIDHHLQCGDALLGLTDLKTLAHGIPKDAFAPLPGDDKQTCKALAKTNAIGLKQMERERTGQQELLPLENPPGLNQWAALEALSIDTPAAKQEAYDALRRSTEDNRLSHAADLLLGAFLLPKTPDTAASVPISATFYLELVSDQRSASHGQQLSVAREACRQARVFHWPLAFPKVFAEGGFDCVLGNPPWEVSQIGEEEFFASRAPHIALLGGEQRKRAIAQLEIDNPTLWKCYVAERQRVAAVNNFCRGSGRFPLTAVGKLNTYPLFAETIMQIAAASGRAGFIVPTGIATDDSTKAFFSDIVSKHRLVRLLGLYEIRGWFKDTDDRKSFCLLTLGNAAAAEFLFDAKREQDFSTSAKWFKLTTDEIRLLNPNTLTCPVFRSERDAELTKKLYCAAPILIDENRPDGNHWGISFSQGLFNMTSDSNLFHSASAPDLLPLYEGKMIHQFDHRWATYTHENSSRDVNQDEKRDPLFTVTPRHWVDAADVESRLIDRGWTRGWLVGWRDIALRSVERTVIASVIPKVGVGHTMPLFFTAHSPRMVAALLANLNTLTLDFIARLKVGGTHLTYSYLKQIPILPPERYTEADLLFIVPRVLELTYTSRDLVSWAKDLGYEGPPFAFDLERRAVLRSELDAWFAVAYGLTSEEQRYVLDPAKVMGEDYPSETFRVLKNNEIKDFGEYRTQRLVLREFDRIALAKAEGEPYVSLLTPPPGQQAEPIYSSHGIIRDDIDARLASLLLTMIRQAGRLPRRRLTDAITMTNQSSLLDTFIEDAQGIETIITYQRRYASIFDSARLADGRLQTWLRHFESTGLIRMESQGDQLAAVPTAVVPSHLIFDEETTCVATLLLRAAERASAGVADEVQPTGDSVRHA